MRLRIGKFAEEMVQWRSIRQECTNDLWKERRGKIEEKVLEKFTVEEAKKDAYKVNEVSRKLADYHKRRDVSERRLLGQSFSWLRENSLQRNKGVQA